MNLNFPRPGTPVFDGANEPFSRDWLRWFHSFWSACGFSWESPVYDEIFCTGEDTIKAYAAAGATSSTFGFRLPNSYRAGTDLALAFLWKPTSAAAGNVVLQVSLNVASVGGVLATTTESKTAACPGVASQIVQTDFSAISGTSRLKGDVAYGTIARLGDDAADTYGADITGIGIAIKYRRDGVGTFEVNP